MNSQLLVNKFTLGATAVLAGTAPVWAESKAQAPNQRPNIVFMMADDMGYGNVSCYGTDLVSTPNIDRIAAQGIRFTDAHSPAAVCQPTRYAILAGRIYPRSTWGRTQAGTYFRDGETPLPQLLRESGYSTAMFGKWHLGFGWGEKRGQNTDWNQPLTHGPNWIGFDYWFGMPNSHAQPPYVFVENDRVYLHDPNDPLEVISNKEAEKRGVKLPSNMPKGWGASVGGKAAHEACDLDRLDLIMAERAGKWITEQRADKPFFLYVPFFAPHVPLAVAQEFQGTSPLAKKLGRTNNNGIRTADYCQQLDHCVGVILDALKKNGFEENTLVVFTSDNGNINFADNVFVNFRTNGPFLGNKTDTWEGGHHVPLVVRWPGQVPAGKVSDKLISLTDFYDTFLAAADVAKPDRAGPDSVNQLASLLEPDRVAPPRRAMVYKGRAMGLRIGDWIYLPHQGSGGLADPGAPTTNLGFTNSDYDENNKLKADAPPEQLYNFRQDPAQTTNLYKQYPELVARFKAVQKALGKSMQGRFNEDHVDVPLKDFLSLIEVEYHEQVWPKSHWGVSEPPSQQRSERESGRSFQLRFRKVAGASLLRNPKTKKAWSRMLQPHHGE